MICLSDSAAALSMIYLDSLVASTPSTRLRRPAAIWERVSSSGLRVRIRTAWLSSTVSRGRRPLASRVAPVDTRSQMKLAICSRGASSTAPFIFTTSASMPWSAR